MPTPGGGVRVDAIPVTGGPPRPLLSVEGPKRSRGFVRIVASSGVVAALVLIERDDNPVEWQLYAGPPAGPLALRGGCLRPRAGGCRSTWTRTATGSWSAKDA